MADRRLIGRKEGKKGRRKEGFSLRRLHPQRAGFTIMELVIAMTIMVILVTMSAPMYGRAVEQARLDTAARNLRTIWAAQRIYWLEEHTFADSLAVLQEMDLVSQNVASSRMDSAAPYVYEIDLADSSAFTASVTRSASRKWSGVLQIDEFGDITGHVSGPNGTLLTPMLGE
jgi:prepilin-type N-terminal cleavage/methylation domain-containing protein